MKRIVAVLSLIVAMAVAGFAVAAGGKLDLKAGDTVYVCGCGAGCDCGAMSMKKAKCSCKKEMVKATVVKVEGDEAQVMVDGKDQTFKTTGTYACACGEKCPCNYISQKPGKCGCGIELKKVE